MINLQGSPDMSLQGSGSSSLSLPQPSQSTQPMGGGQPTPAPVVTSQPTIPEYLSRDQARMLLQAAQQKGIDPATALKALVDQGHIVEGVNDQQFQAENQDTASQSSQPSQKMGFWSGVGNALGGFGAGVVKGIGQVENNIARPIANFISKPFASQENIQGWDQANEQFFTPNGTSQKVGAAVGKTLPAIGAGLAGQAELAGPLMAAGASPLVAGSVAQGLGAGAEAFLGNKGSIGQRTKAGLSQGVTQGVFNYGLGKLFPILGLGGGELQNTKAYNETIKAIKGLNNLQGAINGETMNFANLADEAGAQIPISPELKGALNQAANKFGISLPKSITSQIASIGGTEFNLPQSTIQILPSEAQQLLFQLSKKASVPEVNDLMDEVSNQAISALNSHSAGLGDEFGQLYNNWNTRTAILKPALQIFKSKNAVPGPELQADINRAANLVKGPAGKQITQALTQNIKDLGGPDLTSVFNATKAIGQIANPVMKQHAANFVKYVIAAAAGAIGGPKVSKLFSAFGF